MLEAPVAHDESLGPEAAATRRPHVEERVASVALALLPAALVVYFSFEAGGYFAGSVAFVALVLAQLLILRVLFAAQPFAGIGRRHAVVVATFAAYTGWTLASALWSHALGRALVEFDRSLLYLLLLLLFGCAPRRVWRMPLMVRGLAAGSLFVCTVSLITRLLPHVWPIAPGVANNRLSYPLTYWNALGILAAIASVLLLGISANPRESTITRALASAGVPVTSTALFFTFSRGAIAALVVGAVVFLLCGYSRMLPGALLAVLPTTGVAVLASYHASALATLTPTLPAGVTQGRHVAVVVAGSALAALVVRLLVHPIERKTNSLLGHVEGPWRVRRGLIGGAVLGLVAVLLALGAPGFVAREFQHSFRAGTSSPTDLRSRLTDPSNTARLEHWRVALKVFGTAPLIGTGADAFEHAWYRYRARAFQATPVVHAHSLYLQTLSDLGVVGLVLLLGTLLPVLVFIARRIRGPDRVLYGSLFSALLVWALHAGVDWDWQMPAVTAWVFAVGGAGLASSGQGVSEARHQVGRKRVPLAIGLLLTAATPLLLLLAQSHLSTAADAFAEGRCRQAEAGALASIRVLTSRPQPYQILGYCDISDGRYSDGVDAMRQAVIREPGSWEYHYGLAIAEVYAGLDPRPALRVAEALDPGDPLEQLMAPVLRTRAPARWLAIARAAYASTFASGRLTLR